MNDPKRWEADDLPEDIRRMLRAGRPTRGMPREVQNRMARRLGVAFASSTGFALLGWKGMALAATLGVASVTTVFVAQHVKQQAAQEPHEPRAPSARTQPAPHEAAPQVQVAHPEVPEPLVQPPPAPTAAPEHVRDPSLPVQPVPLPRAGKRTSARASAPSPAQPLVQQPSTHAAPPDSLAREIALLGHARAELDRNPRAALADVQEHARLFADGQLVIERELLALDVLERLGRADEARERAQRLLRRATGTIYEQRIRDRVQGR